MKYWMKFLDNDSNPIIAISTMQFNGEDLNFSELKERFNKNFVQNSNCRGCEISFLGNGINKSFIAGFRNNSVVIIDTSNHKEYSSKEFSQQLYILENVLDTPDPIAYLEQ